ncbi:uncharacterized protein LOC134256250 [Saccostrea cucullata]|uniref:uncharacterized protein LOC134256250 n=1 Tax=Saccostrea cuccullata TaxID=36930 RepID=UPI002ED0641E
MATAQGQDIIACSLCQEPVEFYCNLCFTDLCSKCVLIHLKDKTKKHQVVEFSDKKCSLVLPDCSSHDNKCETYCCDCDIPICIKCVTDSHKGHDFSDLENVIENRKKEISSDIEEQKALCIRYQKLKDTILPQEKDFEDIIRKISQREEEVIKSIRNTAEKVRSDVLKERAEIMTHNSENMSKILNAQQHLQHAIEQNEKTMESRFAIDVLNYCSVNKPFRDYPCSFENELPVFSSGLSDEEQISVIFGYVSNKNANHSKNLHLQLPNAIHSVLTTIQSPFKLLRNIHCANNGIIWACGYDNTIRKFDHSGYILQTIKNVHNGESFSINTEGDVLFIAKKPVGAIYIFRESKFKRYLYFEKWFPTGLHFSGKENFLVSLRSTSTAHSRIGRFHKKDEIQQIQYDRQGLPLFSTNSEMILPLIENKYGDICVADMGGKTVVVVNKSGELRFKYSGNIAIQSTFKEFTPRHIAADIYCQILIGDSANDIVHIIDCEGNFVCYVEHPCKGGLSIDTDHNIVVGDRENGLIRIVTY